ncbi:hypothetical protein V7S43_004901 [Phytophthora oleae]|uniref:Uncharacterized protein n=1 Tax=Phytophthora oleae TaxID=2107226 RepID=A0ABD3FRM7_9STRA
MQIASFTAVATAALAFNCAGAHGYVSKPAAQFVDPTASTSYAKTITADVNGAFGGLKWDEQPGGQRGDLHLSLP